MKMIFVHNILAFKVFSVPNYLSNSTKVISRALTWIHKPFITCRMDATTSPVLLINRSNTASPSLLTGKRLGPSGVAWDLDRQDKAVRRGCELLQHEDEQAIITRTTSHASHQILLVSNVMTIYLPILQTWISQQHPFLIADIPMDPLSIAASIITVLDLTTKVFIYQSLEKCIRGSKTPS